jgi:hypothetical protein
MLNSFRNVISSADSAISLGIISIILSNDLFLKLISFVITVIFSVFPLK